MQAGLFFSPCIKSPDTHPTHDDLSDLAHGAVCARGLGELRQQVLVQRDVGVQVAEEVRELLLRHDGQLQHGVVVRLQGWGGGKSRLEDG